MDYTTSADYDTQAGKRLHKDSGPIDTVWSAKDANQIIWGLMKLLEDAGVSAAAFDYSNSATYDRISLAVAARATGLFTGSGKVSLGTSGYQKLPSGLILQWGVYTSDLVSSGSPVSITLPLAFPTAAVSVSCMPRNPSPDGSADAWLTLRSRSTTAFSVGADWAGSGGTDTVHGFDWMALGY